MRFFDTEGPNRADLHYCLPPLGRWDLAEILELIERQKYSKYQKWVGGRYPVRHTGVFDDAVSTHAETLGPSAIRCAVAHGLSV
jgi:hypothetical protein